MTPRILVLGPVGVVRRGRIARGVGPLTSRLLAALVVSVNHAVGVDRLVEAVWLGRPPRRAGNALQAHVSALRRALGDDRIRYGDHCYTLVASCEEIDACVFEREAATAERSIATDPAASAEAARRALALWRGSAFGDLGDDEYFSLEALRLEELRQSVTELLLEAELGLGMTDDAVAKLRAAVVEFPYRERLWQLLISGLASKQRRVEAVRAYDEYAGLLAGIGLLPDERLRCLVDAVAAGDAVGAGNAVVPGDASVR